MQAKVWYLTAVKHYPLYGYAQFPVTYKGFWSHPNTLILAVGADGVKFVNQKTKVVRGRERETKRERGIIMMNSPYFCFSLSYPGIG